MSDKHKTADPSATSTPDDADATAKREKKTRGRGTSKDIREDRGIRQHKLGKHKR